MKFEFEIKKVDVDKWIGLYIDTKSDNYYNIYYLCIIPCYPIIFKRSKR